MKKAIHPAGIPPAIAPYSPAIQVGNWIYVSGQLPVDSSTGALIQDDMKAAALLILKNIECILDSADAGKLDIVKTTVYLTDMADFPEVNKAYAAFFVEPYPARVCVQVAGLPKNARIEIDAIAYRE